MLLTFRIIEVEIFSLVIWGYLSTVRFLVSAQPPKTHCYASWAPEDNSLKEFVFLLSEGFPWGMWNVTVATEFQHVSHPSVMCLELLFRVEVMLLMLSWQQSAQWRFLGVWDTLNIPVPAGPGLAAWAVRSRAVLAGEGFTVGWGWGLWPLRARRGWFV